MEEEKVENKAVMQVANQSLFTLRNKFKKLDDTILMRDWNVTVYLLLFI